MKTGLSSLLIVGVMLAAASPLRAQTSETILYAMHPILDPGLAPATLPAASVPLSAPSGETASSAGYTPLALPCSINVACPEGNGYSDAAKATVRIVQGGDACSGVLLNNTEQDGAPYVLTARHCGTPSVGQTVTWRFDFNYQSSTCADPIDTPSAQSITGATVIAAGSGIGDFALLELSQPIPEYYDVVFAGWSIKDNAPSSSVTIGHPKKDIKKITVDDDPLADANDSWVATFDHGCIESGSSGAPLFNGNGQVIGHLRSALAIDPDACSGPGGDDNAATILFPKLKTIWDQGASGQRISDFLDPENTGRESLNSIDVANVLPVELISFDAVVDGADVLLAWETASELNNAGFEIQGISTDEDVSSWWEVMGFVEGHGTTEMPQSYRYRVEDLDPGRYTFRLKQIDYDGTFEYHPEVEVLVELPEAYALSAAYPNPFNPQAQFRLSVGQRQHVTVEVYNALGQAVAVLFEGMMEASITRTFTIDGSALQSGVYLYRVTGKTFSESRTVMLVK